MVRYIPLLSALTATILGCTPFSQNSSTPTDTNSAGSLLISRPIPAEATTRSLGFVPITSNSNVGRSLAQVDLAKGKIHLIGADGVPEVFELRSVSGLQPGEYTVLMAVNNPLWHATDSYFEARGIPAPALGSKERYLRGALGDSAVFLSAGLTIHSAKTPSDEVLGAAVSSEAMRSITAALRPGSTLLIR